MCIAIYIPQGKPMLTESELEQHHRANPDSFGLLWSDGFMLRHQKGLFEEDSIKKMAQLIGISSGRNYSRLVHFRTASSGALTAENAHPHYVNEELAFVQNGNLFEFREREVSDVRVFNREVLRNLPDGFLRNRKIKDLLEAYNIANMSKMIFMAKDGEVTIINEGHGIWKHGTWYSNGGLRDYTGYGFSGAYRYREGDVRHRGGLLNIGMFPEHQKKKWTKCEHCHGYYIMKDSVCKPCQTLEKLRGYTR